MQNTAGSGRALGPVPGAVAVRLAKSNVLAVRNDKNRSSRRWPGAVRLLILVGGAVATWALLIALIKNAI